MASRAPLNDIVTDIPSHQISFDIPAFDEAIGSQGVRLVHYRAMRCPVGMVNLDDNRRPHPDHVGCTNGFIFTKVGTITALFIGNPKSKKPDDLGFWDGSTVQVTFKRFYDEDEETPIYVAPFDRFYLDEEAIVVPTWQLFVHHESGMDRLKYPVIKVEDLMDARGDRYTESDFSIQEGQLVWSGRQPTPELDLGGDEQRSSGAICSIRYLYRPYWYVGQVLHEIRVTQAADATGERKIHRMPQAVMLHREYVVQSRPQDLPLDQGNPTATNADSFRTILGPMNGGFGPR